MEATVLLKKIINKGGVIGSCGELYVCDEDLASKYIIECSQQLYAESVKTLWGKQLVEQIGSFAELYKKNAS